MTTKIASTENKMTDKTKNLSDLYLKKSKHSSYQKIHPVVEKFLPNIEHIHGKYEAERQLLIEQTVDFKGKTVLEIGCNTGYFTAAAALNEALAIDAYEGNAEHCQFIEITRTLIPNGQAIHVHNEYYVPSNKTSLKYDICIFLNVLHHLGDDFLENEKNVDNAKKKMAQYLKELSFKANTLIFQMGFNWKGNKQLPLFKNGEKHELISFIEDSTKENYYLERILCPTSKQGNYIEYLHTNSNTSRDDDIGEFLNRPFFVLQSKNN